MKTLAEERNITTKLLIDDLEMWDEFDIQKSNNNPKVSVYYNEIINLIDQQIRVSVNWLETDGARDYFYGETKYKQEVFQSLEDEWDNILEDHYNSIDELIETIYHTGKQKGYSDIRQRIHFTDTDKEAIRIARSYNYHLITKLDNDTRHQIKNVITKGVIAGEHPSKIAPQILNVAEEQLEGSIFTPKQRATLIARTETSRIQNTGILQTYINEGYTEIKILTAEDNNVCYTCLKYAFEFNENAEVTLENRGEERVHNIIKLVEDGEFPPFHPLCRCTYLSVWKTKGQLPEDPYIINLTPSLKSPYVFKGKYRGGKIPIDKSRDAFRNALEGIIDEEDMNHVLDMIEKFLEDVKNDAFEWSTGSGKSGYIQNELFPSWSTEGVDLHPDLMEEGLDKGLNTLIHNHARFHAILPSPYDTESFAVYKTKYGIIINDFGICVIKNKNVRKNSQISSKIFKRTVKIKKAIEKEFQNKHPEFVKYQDTNKEKYYAELNKFTRTHSDKYLGLYQNCLDEWFTVSLIKRNRI